MAATVSGKKLLNPRLALNSIPPQGRLFSIWAKDLPYLGRVGEVEESSFQNL